MIVVVAGTINNLLWLNAFIVWMWMYRYGALMRYIPGTAVSAVLSRLALDQLLFAPLFVTTMLTTVTVLDGKASEVSVGVVILGIVHNG